MLSKNAKHFLKCHLKFNDNSPGRFASVLTEKVASNPDSSVLTWSNAKPYDQIPTYSFWEWSKKVDEGKKVKDLRMGDIIENTFVKLDTEIIKVKFKLLFLSLFVYNSSTQMINHNRNQNLLHLHVFLLKLNNSHVLVQVFNFFITFYIKQGLTLLTICSSKYHLLEINSL